MGQKLEDDEDVGHLQTLCFTLLTMKPTIHHISGTFTILSAYCPGQNRIQITSYHHPTWAWFLAAQIY